MGNTLIHFDYFTVFLCTKIRYYFLKILPVVICVQCIHLLLAIYNFRVLSLHGHFNKALTFLNIHYVCMYATIHQLSRNPVFTTMLNEYTVEGFIHLVKTIQQTIQ